MNLHMKYLNRIFKDAISKLGPNTIDNSLQRTAKALKSLTFSNILIQLLVLHWNHHIILLEDLNKIIE